jgi:serine phosphatase RsbU (regulator of sigma subunit)
VWGVWSAASYEPHLLSLPFALAPAAMLIVIAYTAVMRGMPVLRGFLLAHCLSLLPYALVMTLSPSVTTEAAAEELFRIGVSTIPMAAATGTGLQLALIGQYRRFRYPIWLLVASAGVWIVVSSTSDAAVGGVRWLSGYWYPDAGPWAWVALIHTVILSAGGFFALGWVAVTSAPSDERRQLRAAFLANMITYAGLVDVGLAYGVGVFPLGWLLSGIGSLLVVRALIVEDLLRVRAVDTTAPMLVVHLAGGTLLGWVTLSLLPDTAPWWMTAIVLTVSLVGTRLLITTFALMDRGARTSNNPLERLLGQLVTRTRMVTEAPAIAALAIDVIDLGVGVRPTILLASEDDWGFTTQTGAPLADDLVPDPLIVSWLAEEREWWMIFSDDLESVPADLQDAVRVLLERHEVRAFLIVRSGDELLALVAIPRSSRRLRGSQLEFLARLAERLAEALLHARMARRAAQRAVLAREVELAATVQSELLPGRDPQVHGAVTVVGSWKPATRCAGDFWGVYPLADDRVLVAIADVTGHGVASAMVTAGVAGAFDVWVRRAATVDLAELIGALDAAVRRVGGGELNMTCFAAILDPGAKEIRFVSCGHPAPYLCRQGATGALEISALVARGNLLGAGVPAAPKVQQRALEAGDLVVWYTDGVIDALDPAGKTYGDRRMLQLLKKLDRSQLSPTAVHDVVLASVATHRAGGALIDDETIVVAQVRGVA